MHTKVYEIRVSASPEEVWKFHSSADALAKLTPAKRRVKLLAKELSVEDGALHVFRIWMLGMIPIVWKARISQVTPPYGFTDQAEKSPFQFWRHRHDFIPDGDGTLIRDVIAYVVPFGKLGKVVNKFFISKDLDKMFEHRHAVTRRELG